MSGHVLTEGGPFWHPFYRSRVARETLLFRESWREDLVAYSGRRMAQSFEP
jgi:hypothetical protein